MTQIPLPLNELLTKLTVISLIEKDYKLNVSNLSFVASTSWSGSVSRYLYGESRKNLMTMLNNVIQDTIHAIADYENTEFVKLIVNHLLASRDGIVNIKYTYEKDPNIQAQIEVLLENIDIQLNKNNDHISIKHFKEDIESEVLDNSKVLEELAKPINIPKPIINKKKVNIVNE